MERNRSLDRAEEFIKPERDAYNSNNSGPKKQHRRASLLWPSGLGAPADSSTPGSTVQVLGRPGSKRNHLGRLHNRPQRHREVTPCSIGVHGRACCGAMDQCSSQAATRNVVMAWIQAVSKQAVTRNVVMTMDPCSK